MTKLSRAEVMKRAGFIRFETKMILKFDLSNLDEIDDVKKVTKYCRLMVEKMPHQSMLGMVNFSGMKITDEVTQEMIHLNESCNPYFRATAVIANDLDTIGLTKALINHFGDVDLPVYQEEETAKQWLFSQ